MGLDGLTVVANNGHRMECLKVPLVGRPGTNNIIIMANSKTRRVDVNIFLQRIPTAYHKNYHESRVRKRLEID